jgi:hypothetical protein
MLRGVHLGQRLDRDRVAGSLEPLRLSVGSRDLALFRSKIRTGKLTPKPIVLSRPIRWYSIWGVTSHQAFARASLTSA